MKEGHITLTPRNEKGLRVGDIVIAIDMGLGVVVGFSSMTGEPHVFFYAEQAVLCIGADVLKRI